MPAVVSGFTITVRPYGREISYGPDRWARSIISVHLVENIASIKTQALTPDCRWFRSPGF
jgi:hypothetical protein